MLSILAYNQPDGEVQGINDLQAEYEQKYGPGNYVPERLHDLLDLPRHGRRGLPDARCWPLWALIRVLRNRVAAARRFMLALLPFAIALPYLANTTGWLLTELGRQPWIVFGLMQTAQGVSPTVPGGQVLRRWSASRSSTAR